MFVTSGGFCQQKPRFHVILIGQDTTNLYKYKWMAKYFVDVLKSIKLDYKKPDGFKEVPGWDCFDSIPKLHLILSCANNQLYADDGHFMAFITINRPFTPHEIIEWKKLFPNGLFDNNKAHMYQIKGNIKYAYGDQAALEWRKYVTYYSTADAKNKFNADTAITFPLKLDSSDYYKGKYKYLNVLFLEKKDRSWVSFHCFSDDEGKKNLAKYMKAIEGVFRYED